MRTHNKVTLIGNVGKTPDLQILGDGISVLKFSLATSETYRDKNGNSKTDTDWHAIVAWGKLAEFTHKSIKKGCYLFVEGKLKTRNYEGKDGIIRYVTEIIAEQIIFLDKKTNNESN